VNRWLLTEHGWDPDLPFLTDDAARWRAFAVALRDWCDEKQTPEKRGKVRNSRMRR